MWQFMVVLLAILGTTQTPPRTGFVPAPLSLPPKTLNASALRERIDRKVQHLESMLQRTRSKHDILYTAGDMPFLFIPPMRLNP